MTVTSTLDELPLRAWTDTQQKQLLGISFLFSYTFLGFSTDPRASFA